MGRQLATGTNQVMTFLKWYRAGSMEDSLSVAVEKFFNLY